MQLLNKRHRDRWGPLSVSVELSGCRYVQLAPRTWLCLFFAVVANVVFWAQGGLAGTMPPDMERLEKQGFIVVALLSSEVPPFFMQDEEGELFGLDIELAENIAAELGLDIRYNREAVTYDDIVKVVYEGKADIAISNLSRTLKRSRMIRFTEPYVILYQTVLINRLMASRKGHKQEPRQYLDHSDVRISTLANSSYMDFSRESFPKATVVPYTDLSQAIVDVLEGKNDAFIFDNIFAQNWHYNNPKDALYLQTVIMKDSEDHISMAVNWQDTHLLSWLELYLKNIEASGFLKELTDRYMEGDTWRARWQQQKKN